MLAKANQAGDISIVTPGRTPIEVSHAGRFDIVSAGNPQAAPMRVNTSRQILIHDPGGFPVLLMERVN